MNKKRNFNWASVPNYSWPVPEGEVNNVRYFAELSRNLQTALKSKNNDRVKNSVQAILDWGGVRQESKTMDFSESIMALYKQYNGDGKEAVKHVKDVIRKGRERKCDGLTSTWRIASWTKVLAAAFPGIFFIYDARVAVGLREVTSCDVNKTNWPIPPSRRDEILEYSKKIEGKAMNMPDAYKKYLEWLQKNILDLPQEISKAYKETGLFQSDLQIRMAHMEKMLFMVSEIISKRD